MIPEYSYVVRSIHTYVIINILVWWYKLVAQAQYQYLNTNKHIMYVLGLCDNNDKTIIIDI